MSIFDVFKNKDDDAEKQEGLLTKQVDNLQKRLDERNDRINELKKQKRDLQGKQREAEVANEELAEAQAQVQELEAELARLKAASTAPATGGMAVGNNAWVQRAGGMNLRLRNAPGLNSEVLGGLEPGSQLTLLEGPRSLDNYTWWRIRASDGREGWVAGEELVTQPE